MNEAIQEYLDMIHAGTVPMCREQKQLAELVEFTFETEDLRVDEEQLERYLKLQKHFPYKLLPWEKFCFALHNCVYDASGELRWPELVIVVGRGAGKNGYLSFEDFALLTPVNGVRDYNIDIFAMSEAQAKTTFEDIWTILESDEKKFRKYFRWTKEEITNIKTNSTLTFRTSSPKSADGARPGKVDNDEIHAYTDARLMDVGTTGLGKKRHPRQTKISTMGDVRDGPMDRIMERAEKVLAQEQPDRGVLYFICRLDNDAEIDDEKMWVKANPSLLDPTRPQLLNEIRKEYWQFKEDPIQHASFATKRMNRPMGNAETAVTDWNNILAASAEIPEGIFEGRPAAAGIDYASTQDFVSAGILVQVGGTYYFQQHTWICLQSKTLHRIKFPYQESAARGECTLVDGPEIDPELPIKWVMEQEQVLGISIQIIGMDHYRFTLMSKVFGDYGINTTRKGGILKLTYTPEQSQVAPVISSAFLNHRIIWGDCMIMRWFTNNATRVLDKKGNITFGKNEPKSRKTDGFMCLVACFVCAMQPGIELDVAEESPMPDVYTY